MLIQLLGAAGSIVAISHLRRGPLKTKLRISDPRQPDGASELLVNNPTANYPAHGQGENGGVLSKKPPEV